MNKVIFLIGPPASGKSTWRAKYLETMSRPTTIISSDDEIEAYARQHGLTYTEAFSKVDFQDIDGKIMRNFRMALLFGDDIIIDRTNMKQSSRKHMMKIVPDTYQKHAVVFQVPRAELQRRLDARAKATGKFIPPKVVEDMLASFVPPSQAEFDEIDYV